MSLLFAKQESRSQGMGSEEELLQSMARESGCIRIYKYTMNFGDKVSPLRYKAFGTSDHKQESAFLNNPFISSIEIVYQAEDFCQVCFTKGIKKKRGCEHLEALLWIPPIISLQFWLIYIITQSEAVFLLFPRGLIFFCMALFFPAAGYSIWRQMTRYKWCKSCNHPVGETSPTNIHAVTGFLLGCLVSIPVISGLLAIIISMRAKYYFCEKTQGAFASVGTTFGFVNVCGWLCVIFIRLI